jgi:type I restriction enzyme S subunit
MQQLFPAEGETLPKLRFPEFRDTGEWEERRLGDVCDKVMDGTHFSPKSKSGSCLYLTSKNIQNGIIDLSNISYISEEEHKQIYKRCPVLRNDVLLTKDGVNTGNCAINNLEFEFSLLSSVAVLRTNQSLLNHRFLYQLVLSEKTQRIIKGAISGQAITRITLEKIGNFSVSITNLPEQQKIADCLTSIDEAIATQAETIELLKLHKKGLMQQLFPSVEEVRG